MKKIMKVTTILGISLLTLTGCGKIPTLENGKEIVVELENTNITVDDLYKEIKNRFARDVLIDMIDKAILNENYETDDNLNAKIQSQIDAIKEQTGENFLEAIKGQWGLNNEDELYNFIEISFKRNLAIEDYIASIIEEDEIEQYYENNIVGDIKASHILIKPEVTNEMTIEEQTTKEEEALAIAEEVITKLNDGEDFSELAAQYSNDDANKENGGDLGWFNKGIMDSTFEDAAYKLEDNEYTKTPIKSQFGYHIILKTGTKEKSTLENSREKIIDELTEQKLEEDSTINYIALEKLREDNGLNIYDTELKNQYNNYMNLLRNQKSE